MGIAQRDYMRSGPRRLAGQLSAVSVIIGNNVLVFLAWNMNARSPFMWQNFMVYLRNVEAGRPSPLRRRLTTRRR